MIYDPSAQIVMDAQLLFKELIVQDGKVKDRNATRDVRKQAEDQAENLRKKLLQINPDAPTVLRTYLTATELADAEALKTTWQKTDHPIALEPQKVKPFFDSIWKSPTIDLAILPACSFTLQFTFTLAQPYLSKDDNPFYIIDNPVVRDKVFRLPMVRPSSWKGSLRRALWQQGHQKESAQIQRIFGDTKDDVTGKAGRLHFYPTFFDKTSLEIINPHNRKTKVGKNQILLESVPAGATGTFTLLYAPLDRIGNEKADPARKQKALPAEVAEDLELVAQGLQAMLTLYGFGAKTSSGFGLAVNAVRDGIVVVGGLPYEAEPSVPDAVPPPPAQPDLPRYLAAPFRLDPDFVSETGGLKSEAEYQRLITGRGQRYAKKDKQLYDKAKSWWEREGQQLAQQPEPEVELEPTPEIPPSYPLASETLDTFNDLPVKTQKLANALRQAKGSEA